MFKTEKYTTNSEYTEMWAPLAETMMSYELNNLS